MFRTADSIVDKPRLDLNLLPLERNGLAGGPIFFSHPRVDWFTWPHVQAVPSPALAAF